MPGAVCLFDFFKSWDIDHFTASHGRMMRTDTGSGPVSAFDIIHQSRPFFKDRSDKFVDEVGMGTAVSAALYEREMAVFIIIYGIGSKISYFFWKEISVIRNLDTFFKNLAAPAGLCVFIC